MRRAAVLAGVAAAITLAAAVPTASAQQPRPRWDTRLLALVPQPGFPAHAYVHPNGRIYEGTFVNPDSRGPSRVFEYSGDGQLLRSWEVAGQRVTTDHGVQAATSDERGRLVLLSHPPARALLLDRRTGEQITYATFPPLGGTEAVPNYAAWGPDGSLYVTDYANNVVWRVPPGGGTAELWLQDPRLQTLEFGTTGIELAADRRTVLITQQTSPASGNPLTGGLFAVEIRPDGKPGTPRRLWESRAMDLADGFAIARSGRIYMAAPGPNQLIVLGPDGREQERIPQAPLLGENGSAAPFDTPSNAAFLGTRLIIANQSNPSANPDHWALLDVEAGEEGLPEHIPPNAGEAPALTLTQVRLAVRAGRIRFRLSAPAEVVIRIQRRATAGRRWVVARTLRRSGRSGANTVALPRGLRPGRYRVVLQAGDSTGRRSRRVITRSFRVAR